MMRVVTIIGGPGTGKTRELTRLFSEAVGKYGLDKVAFVSYTRSQVGRGRASASGMLHVRRGQLLDNFKTLHSFSKGQYEEDVRVLDSRKVNRMSEYLGSDMETVSRGIDFMRNSMTGDDAIGANRAGLTTKDFQKMKRFYEKVKEGMSQGSVRTVDFADMVEDASDNDSGVGIKAAFVDEAQDLSPLQWKAVYTMFSDAEVLYVAGDPNQALYRFAGAVPYYMLEMRSDEMVFLDRSHRCSPNVMAMAEAVWNKMVKKAEMPRPTNNEHGFAVFYPKTGSVSEFLEPIQSLRRSRHTVMVLANTYYQLVRIKEDLLGGRDIPHDFRSGRIRYKGKAEYRGKGKHKKYMPRIVFSTVHQAKGLEADFVLYDASFGQTARMSDFGSEGEKWQDYWRMMYVAITRAKSMLVVCSLSRPRAGEPNCLDLLYYTKHGMKQFGRFMQRKVKTSDGQDSTT